MKLTATPAIAVTAGKPLTLHPYEKIETIIAAGKAVASAVKWTAMEPDLSASLEEQLGELRSRVRRLEEALQSRGVLLPQADARTATERATDNPAKPLVSLPVPDLQQTVMQPPAMAEAPIARPLFHFTAPSIPEDNRSLESRIGSQWFNRVGILAMLIGMAWFLKLAIDNHWIGPLGRVLIGLIAGAALIAWSERFRNHGYASFSYSLKAVGSGILYLSLWAAFSLFHLIPAEAAFAAMIVVTAFNGFMAWVQDAELLALYAVVGGLSTPLLLSTGENHQITLFSYLLLLDIAVLVLVALRPWSRLLFAAFAGTVLFFVGWWFSFYSNSQSGRTALFLGCFFLIFAFAPRLVQANPEDVAHSSEWDKLAQVLLPIANAVLGFIAFYALLDQPATDWAAPWLAVAFAAFYLFMLRLPAQGRLKASPELLSALHLAAAVVFLTIAIPLKAHGRWLTIGWLGEGAALLWVASRVRTLLLRALAVLCLALGLVALLVVNPAASAMPILNQRFATYCAAIAVFAFTAWLAARAQCEDEPEPSIPWPVLAAIAVSAMNALILLAVGLEIHSYWWNLRWSGDWNLFHDYQMNAQFTYSAWFMLFGAILLGIGFWRRSAFLRWQALLLLAVSIGKVFLVDVSELSQGYRIVSFLGLGALLLGVSFVYQRDWLNLRGHEHRHEHCEDTEVPSRRPS
ncbi:MAG: DUF2339 domain-containing protein [Terracidiphilus sp.]|nr:DUF2339 domain-containing protein [Terracidiphilus sp.]MDR3776588.1 DUF2339 domain-containing protein [Terracidiphilus sp.]